MSKLGIGLTVFVLVLGAGAIAAPAAANGLAVTAAAAMGGSVGAACGGNPCGLEVTLDNGDTSDAYVQSDHPTGEATFNVDYYIDPNNLDLPGTKFFVSLAARRASSPNRLHILHYIRRNASESQYKLITWARDNGGTWQEVANFRIQPAQDTAVRMEWTAGTPGTVSMFKNGGLRGSINLTNDGYSVDEIQWGATFLSTAQIGSTSSFYLDEYVSTR